MTENVPARGRKITVRGWEPLGNICKGTSCKKRAEPYKFIEGGTQGTFSGTWGYHYFTLNQLQKRAKAYWNQWSDNWSSYDYVSFRGMKVLIPADQFHSWMISFDAYLQTKEGYPLKPSQNNEDEWIHPGIMINNPKTHLILPQNYHSKARFYKLWVKPPPGWKGYERFPEAMNYIICHWCWTMFSLNQPFFDACNCTRRDIDGCVAEPWWTANGLYDKWVDRSKYEDCAIGGTQTKTWGPFLQAQNCSEFRFSAYFLYKAYFKFRGTSIWRPLPSVFANDGLVPPAPGIGKSSPFTAYKKRPLDEADILPGDLDSDGILKDGALERITGAHHDHKRRKVEKRHRRRHLGSQHISDKLEQFLNKWGLLI